MTNAVPHVGSRRAGERARKQPSPRAGGEIRRYAVVDGRLARHVRVVQAIIISFREAES